MSKRLALLIAVAVIFLSSAGIVTFLSAQEGSASPPLPRASQQKALPLETEYAPDSIRRTNTATVWRFSRDLGVLVSRDGGKSWSDRNQGLPRRLVYPFHGETPPIVTDLAVNCLDESKVGITTLDTLFLSRDGGATWRKVELKDPIRANDQLTSVALCPQDDNTIAIGTSFHGFFESTDGGVTWTSLAEQLAPLRFGGGYYEEIASLAYDPVHPRTLWVNLGFGKGLYALRRGAQASRSVALPNEQGIASIRDIAFRRSSPNEGWYLGASSADARWAYSPASGMWKLVEKIQTEIPVPPERAARRSVAANKFGIYVAARQAAGDLLKPYIDFARSQGMNSIVIDFKDDFGYLTYDTALEAPQKMGAVKRRFAIDEVVRAAHANGLYLIGRMVVFRDKQLYNSDGFAHAIWDRNADAPWRYLKRTVDEETGTESFYQGEYWVDPYSEYVWDYNIAIARELQDRGVDEVQFDYIRFPSDGDLSRMRFRYKKPGMGKLEALESFLAKAREALTIPISADVYGYCGWARISNWVAQNIETYSRYIDVIQPMFYPSHFPRDFLGSMEYIPRARFIYEEGSRRAARIVEGRSLIRPYVQAFRIGGELRFTPAVYTSYLANQVQGAMQGGSSGFTLWNAANDYYMAAFPLGALIQHHSMTRTDQVLTSEASDQALSTGEF